MGKKSNGAQVAPQTSNPTPPIKEENLPIDKFFWFNLSRKWVANGIEFRTKVCEQIKNAVAWFFGLGTSGIFLTLIFSSDSFKGLDVTHGWIPLLLLLASYGLAVMGQTVSMHKDFDPNVHDTIRVAYNKVMLWSRVWIILSATCLMGGLVSFPVVLLNAVAEKNKAASVITVEASQIRGSFEKTDTLVNKKKYWNLDKINLAGKLADKQQTVRVVLSHGKSVIDRLQFFEQQVHPDTAAGSFFLTIIPKPKLILDPKEQIFATLEYPKEVENWEAITVVIKETKLE
ncbi:MAG: hypothetical protein AAGJ93_14020 [Bacteroidota bacterium]